MNEFTGSCGSHPCPVSSALIEAARTLEMRLEQALAPLQLSLAKFGVLRCLVHEARPLPLSAIATRQRCVRSNMTQLADRLEADGLVRRVDDPNDRRAVLAEPTEAGRAALTAAQDVLRTEEERFLLGLSREERALMTELVRRFVSGEAAHATT
ncbi:MAG TPA: MarR family transcriptional regulator [Luteitalea sp.]|nr:MarR family transcriptional regulator [Luteitalea sp.]